MSRLAIDADGALAIHPQEGPTVWHRRPYLYQTTPDGSRREVSGRFVLLSATDVGFETGVHDPSLPLSIDPVIDSAAYLGGRGDDRVVAQRPFATIGTTSSIDFPGQASRRRGRDVFLEVGGATTIFGGSGDDEALAAGDGFSSGISVGGVTDSPDLPTTFAQGGQIVRGWQPEFAGGATDGFIASFSQLASFAPLTISYVGGPGDDRVTAMPQVSFVPALVGTTTARGLGPSQGARTPLMVGPGGGVDGFSSSFSIPPR